MQSQLEMPPVAANDKLLTVEELAEKMQMSREWVLDQVKEGVIPCIKFNSRTFRFHWPTVLHALSKL